MVPILKTGERINGTFRALRQRVAGFNDAGNNHGHIEEEYRKLFELSPVGIIVLDMNGVVRSCSPAVYRDTGYSEEDYIGKHFSEIATVRKRDAAKYNKLFESVVRGDKLPPFEWIYKRRDGTIGWSEIYCSLLEEDGRKTGILVLKRDITECKKAAKMIRDSEERFSKIFRASPNLFIITRIEDDTIIDVNDSFMHMSGYTREEAVGHTALELGFWVNPEDRKRVVQMLKERGAIINEEYNFRRKSGERRVGLLSAELSNIGGEPCIIFIAADITEYKQAAESLRESEEKYRDLLDNTNDLIQSVTPDGRFRYVNNAWRQALGYSEKEISDLRLFDVIHPDYLQHYKMLFSKIMSGEDVGQINVAFVGKNGSKIIVEGNVNCQIVDGKPVYTRGIFRDITQNKYLEEQMFRLSSAVSMSAECIIITDVDARITDVNAKAIEMYGADNKGELIGRHFLELIAPADRAMVNIDVGEVVKKGCLESREYHMISKEGHEFPVQMSTSLVRDAVGNLMGMVRIGRELNGPNS